jgi:hypothetical protein
MDVPGYSSLFITGKTILKPPEKSFSKCVFGKREQSPFLTDYFFIRLIIFSSFNSRKAFDAIQREDLVP